MAQQSDSNIDNLECSICLELLCEPTQLPCSHVFCRKCLALALKDHRQCALCRANIPDTFNPVVAPVNQRIERILMRQCTVEYEQRVEDVALEAAHLVRLKIGNKYDFLGFTPRPKHQWTLEVELEAQPEACMPRNAALPDIIKHVRFGLPPACRVLSSGSRASTDSEMNQSPPRYVEVDAGPFQVTAVSPMSCTVPIIITWQDWIGQVPLRLEHQLDFTREGGCWDYGVDLHAALTGKDLRDLEQAQDLQRQQQSRPFFANELSHDTTEISCNSQAVACETQACRGKRRSAVSTAWSAVRRHLPQLHTPLTSRRMRL